MEFTGERPTLDHEIKSSRFRYKSIIPYCRDKRIIDLGCGIGQGSFFLSHYSKMVVGVDVSVGAIKEAKLNFERYNDLIFFCITDFKTLLNLDNIDLLAMVEVFEHIEPEDISVLLEVASKIGEMVITTPNGDLFQYHPLTKEQRTGYHVWHYTYQELHELFNKYFKYVEITGHVFDPILKQFTGYTVFASNKIKWQESYLVDVKMDKDEIPSVFRAVAWARGEEEPHTPFQLNA